jgi:hypothetical protein
LALPSSQIRRANARSFQPDADLPGAQLRERDLLDPHRSGRVYHGGPHGARTSIADSYGDLPRQRHVINKLAVTAPAIWIAAGWLSDPEHLVELHAVTADAAVRLEAGEQKIAAEQVQRGAPRITLSDQPRLPLPPGWQGRELTRMFEVPMDGEQEVVMVVAARELGDRRVLAALTLPASMLRAAPALFAGILASIEPI